MQQKRKLLLTGLLGLGIAVGIYAGQVAIVSKADGATQPGSADDPLVTKSYLDEQLKKLSGGQWTPATPPAGQTGSGGTGTSSGVSEARVQELLAAEIAKLKQQLQNQGATVPPSTPSGDSALIVLKLQQGQTLYGGIGAELIVRSGKTIVVSNDDGIPDVTAGKDIAAGSTVDNNHLLVIPREGRGIKPDPKVKDEIYVMVRGTYILLNEDGSKGTP
ncbi:hypothetical protein ACFFNY_33445 [Paenibacillus hodogayensis]|uniref:Uncharacterized protein n=1 Tax=Paenibacillus hodogayensis TaxID=279208 RepID=A0ABV5W7P2_9BACL